MSSGRSIGDKVFDYIVQVLGMTRRPFSDEDVKNMLIKMGYTRRYANDFKQCLGDPGYFVRTRRSFDYFCSGPQYLVRTDRVLENIEGYTSDFINSNLKFLKALHYSFDPTFLPEAFYRSFLKSLCAYQRMGRGTLKTLFEKTKELRGYELTSLKESLEEILFLTLNDPEWTSLFLTIPETDRQFVDYCYFNFANSRVFNADVRAAKVFFDPIPEDKAWREAWFALYGDLPYSGWTRLNREAFEEEQTIQSLMLDAVCSASQGQLKEGGKSAMASLKAYLDWAKTEYVPNVWSFFSEQMNILLGIILFLDRGSGASLRKMTSLQKKAALREDELFAANFLSTLFKYAITAEEPSEYDFLNLRNQCRQHRTWFRLLPLAAIYKIFNVESYKDEIEENLKYFGSELPPYFLREALVAISPEDPRIPELNRQLGIPPLLSGYQYKAQWQFGLDKLLNLTKTFKKTGKTTASKSRIVYLVDPDDRTVRPFRQKSKDGRSWSKGTEIGLSTFARGAPDMDETDVKVSSRVEQINGRSCRLGGNQVLYDLADSGKAFLCLDPEVPYDIRKGELRIEVVREKDGSFAIKTNVDSQSESPECRYISKPVGSGGVEVFENTDNEQKVLALLQGLRKLPKEAEADLRQVLEGISAEIPVSSELLKNSEGLAALKSSTRVTFQIIPDASSLEFQVRAFVRPADGCALMLNPGEGLEALAAAVNGRPKRILRDLAAEKKHWEILSEKLSSLYAWKEDEYVWGLGLRECLDLLEKLREESEISVIEWPEGAKLSVLRKPLNFPDLHLQISTMDRWFSLQGTVSIDGKTQLKINEILDRLKDRAGDFIHLEGGQYVAITQQLRKQLELLEEISSQKKEGLTLSRFSSDAIEEFKENGSEVKADAAYKKLKERISKAEERDYPVPAGLQATLRPYQQEGFEWLSRLCGWGAGAILADDMGLGKTVQAIALLLSRRALGASLLVVPTTVLFNWKQEFRKFAPSLRIADFNFDDRSAILSNIQDYDVVLCSYGVMNSSIDELKTKEWNLIILDEAHIIKNKTTQTSHSVMELNADARVLLSGTPVQNHLGEIWNLFEFANPGYLGTFNQFNERFTIPIEKKKDKEKQKLLSRLITPFILRRTKSDVLDELPEKTELTVPVKLSEPELAVYESIRTRTLDAMQSDSMNPIEALAALTKLRLAACSAQLVDKHLTIPSSKTEVFKGLVDELMENNHRALVFSQFTAHLALIREALDKAGVQYLYLDGSTPAAKRKKLVEAFQNGDMPLFLVSLRAGGTGLNLTAADYVIHLDPWWNPAVEDQASDRAYRIGQKRPVTIYKLISENTVEEKIMELHKTKKNLADALLEGTNVAKQLSKEEILELLQLSS